MIGGTNRLLSTSASTFFWIPCGEGDDRLAADLILPARRVQRVQAPLVEPAAHSIRMAAETPCGETDAEKVLPRMGRKKGGDGGRSH